MLSMDWRIKVIVMLLVRLGLPCLRNRENEKWQKTKRRCFDRHLDALTQANSVFDWSTHQTPRRRRLGNYSEGVARVLMIERYESNSRLSSGIIAQTQ